MLEKRNSKKENEVITQLVNSDNELKMQHEVFVKEMEFKQKLIDARKSNNLTQKDISERTGLSQQAVSRLERGQGGTIDTIIKYLNSMGMSLSISCE